jgi:hypothetical protein
MTAFVPQVTVPFESRISSMIGAKAKPHGQATSVADIGKAVKLTTTGAYILPTAGDDIDGFIASIESFGVNGENTNGTYSFGSVLNEGRIVVRVGSDQGSTAMVIGDYVVTGAGQEALGTNTDLQWNTYPTDLQWNTYSGTNTAAPGTAPSITVVPAGRVKTGVAGVAGTSFSTPKHKDWRCIWILSGTGVAGDQVIIERD